MNAFIKPNWPLANNIQSIITTRFAPEQGNQEGPIYGAFNLGEHVDDDLAIVNRNRQQLVDYAKLPAMPAWQKQVHGTQVQIIGKTKLSEADACYSRQVGQVCAIMTADCLPILLADQNGQELAAVHAGWRGLLDGVIENTLRCFESKKIIAYLGPAISQAHYQVGQEVYQAFIKYDNKAKTAFVSDGEKYKMNIVELAKQRLQQGHIHQIYGGEYCTYAETRFYSYRQACHQGDGRTGRMASLIWRTD